MDRLNEQARARFDREAAYAAYCTWVREGTPAALTTAFELALSAIGLVRWRHPVDPVVAEDLTNAAAHELFDALRKRRFAGTDARVYENYLTATAAGAMRHALKQEQRQAFDFLFAGQDIPIGRPPGRREAEGRVFLEQLPQLIVTEVCDLIDRQLKTGRFTEHDGRACRDLLNRLLRGQPISERVITDRFGVPKEDVTLLVDFVTLSVRSSIYAVREELKANGGILEDWRDLLDFFTPEYVEA